MNEPTLVAPSAGQTPNALLTQLFEEYKRHRPLGPKTRTEANYERAWTGFVSFRRHLTGCEPTLADLTTSKLNGYLTSLRDAGRAEQTLRTYGSDIRSAASGMRRHGLVQADTLRGFEPPIVTLKAPEFFDDQALTAIFGRLEANRTTLNLRLRAVAQIMLDCGSRPEEVMTLRFADLQQANSTLFIQGKGARNRVVPVGQTTWQFLDDYLRVRPRPTAAAEPVLVTTRGRSMAASATTLASDMRDVLIELGLVESGNRADGHRDAPGYKLYTMRKTFAHRAASAGMHVAELAAIMGHAANSIPMLLERYYQIPEAQKRRAHAAARPADSFDEWRASQPSPLAAARPFAYFELWADPQPLGGGRI